MYDNFPNLGFISNREFRFHSSRYEIWMNQQVIDSGFLSVDINMDIINETFDEKVKVTLSKTNLENEISSNTIFDRLSTSGDRLRYVTIPRYTNVENVGVSALQNFLGTTRNEKSFGYNEPYCCNMFFKNGQLALVTFSFSNPEKLIEFYP